jgi:hypothetical protein
VITGPTSDAPAKTPSSRRAAAKTGPASRKPAAPPKLTGLDALTALKVDYALALPGRVRRLATALRAWRRAPGTFAHLERARALAHRLRGTAGSYGFAAVGQAAGRIEIALFHTTGAPSEAHAAAWDEIWSALRAAESLADHAIHELPGRDGAR